MKDMMRVDDRDRPRILLADSSDAERSSRHGALVAPPLFPRNVRIWHVKF